MGYAMGAGGGRVVKVGAGEYIMSSCWGSLSIIGPGDQPGGCGMAGVYWGNMAHVMGGMGTWGVDISKFW